MESRVDEKISTRTNIVFENRLGSLYEEERVQGNTTGEDNSENCVRKRALNISPSNNEASLNKNSKY